MAIPTIRISFTICVAICTEIEQAIGEEGICLTAVKRVGNSIGIWDDDKPCLVAG